MKIILLPLAGIVPAFSFLPAHGQSPGTPVLSTPGTATWSDEITPTGTRTVFTITGDTVLDWGQFHLGSGSELVFDFVGGDSVVNMLGGSSTHLISGAVTSNGNVGFFSPNAPIRVTGTGSITASNVTIATMNVDPAAFNAGGDFTMTAASGAALSVSGTVTATGGTVLLAGETVRVAGSGKIAASEAVRLAGGRQVEVSAGGSSRRLNETSGRGFVLHLGESRAPRIEIAAGQEINNGGLLDTGSKHHRIFLEVGDHGSISNEGNGLIVGDVRSSREPGNGIVIDPHDGDSATALSSSVIALPALKRPDGVVVSKERTLVSAVPMSGSADNGRDRGKPSHQVASRGTTKEPMLKRASFFGMRGGSATVKR